MKKCDRCGKRYNTYCRTKHHTNITHPAIMGVSCRCVERVWEVCNDCLSEFIKFMERK